MKYIRIGSGAGYSGDRIEPAIELATYGDVNYLCFECLAERTIAIAQQSRLKDPDSGYDPLLVARFQAILPITSAKKIKIITNMGAANPIGAMHKTLEIARSLNLHNLKVAAVSGDDVLEIIKNGDYIIDESGEKVASLKDKLVSANAYLGTQGIIKALKMGADIIITGRVADPSLFLAPLMYEFNWAEDDWANLGLGTGVGHLLECAAQVCGGYYADPPQKQVSLPHKIGFPIAQVGEDKSIIVTKVENSGGRIDTHTCTEQLIYEIHDPTAYKTPDVTADFSKVSFEQIGKDIVKASGFSGQQRSEFLKVSMGYKDSYIGEGQISYGGLNAVARGQLALDTIKDVLPLIGVEVLEERYDLIGVNSLYGNKIAKQVQACEPSEVRARVAVRTKTLHEANLVANAVEALYVNGPAGGAGAFKSAREVIGIVSTYIPRNLVKTHVICEEV